MAKTPISSPANKASSKPKSAKKAKAVATTDAAPAIEIALRTTSGSASALTASGSRRGGLTAVNSCIGSAPIWSFNERPLGSHRPFRRALRPERPAIGL